MSRTVLVVALGPVQDFIGRARRMRDLWFGSHLLSEMSRAAARALAEAHWELAFPALKRGDDELEPCRGTRRDVTGQLPLGIANKVVAVKEGASDLDAEAAARLARAAAIGTWEGYAADARERAGAVLDGALKPGETPEAVIGSLLECVAAWARFEAPADFEGARATAEQGVASRKTLRDFRAWEGGPYRKSSLDGQRESILVGRQHRNAPERPAETARKLRLPSREHLDGIGFVKRAGGKPEQFVPIARVATQPWLRAVAGACRNSSRLAGAFDSLKQASRHRVPSCERGVTEWLDPFFLFDGEIFFEGQWPALDKELGIGELLKNQVAPLLRAPLSLPEPHPYVALLRADADHMGRALSHLPTAVGQASVSRALASFSARVRRIVEAHDGLHIYAGGDDVLAILPVVNALACAGALREAFVAELARPFSETEELKKAAPTLSVGVAFTHLLTPLADGLELSQQAERYAKHGDGLSKDDPRLRNALAVLVDKRSGGTSRWRAQWLPGAPNPVARVQQLTALLAEGKMPSKLPYELRDHVLKALRAPDQQHDDRLAGRCYRLETLRVIARKRSEGGRDNAKLTPESVGLTALPDEGDARVDTVREALDEWVGAAMVAAAVAQAERNVARVKERGEKLAKEERRG